VCAILILMTRTAGKLACPVLLFVITVAFFWKLVLSGQYTWLDGSDITFQMVPWFQVQAVQWHSGHFPLWDTHMWTGQPLLGQVQTGTLNPLNWALFSAPLKDGFIRVRALHWYWVAIHYLAVLCGYLLCRDLRLSRMASVLAGCAFGLGGFVGAIGWPQKAMSALLLPLVLMFFLRVLRRENALANGAASGALLGAAFFSGHHDVPVFFSLLMGGLWIYYFTSIGGVVRWRAIMPAAAFVICLALIAAAQILPAVEMGRLSLRWVNAPDPVTWNEKVPYSVHQDLSLYPTAVLGIVIPGFQHDSVVFIGLVVMTLALLGVAARWQERTVRLLAAVALAGLIFSLGGSSLFHGVLYALVPGLEKARSPSTAEAIFHLGVVVLAAYGLDAFRSAQANRQANRFSIGILGALSLFLYGSLIVLITVRPEQSEEYKVLALAALVAMVLAGLLWCWSRSWLSNRSAGVLVIALLLFELNNVSNYALVRMGATVNLHKLNENRDVAAFVQNTSLARVDVEGKDVPYNFGDWFGVDELGGFSTPLKSIAENQGDPRYRSVLAVNYFIGRNAVKPDQSVVFEGQSGLKVFLNPGAYPRARIVHAAIGAADDAGVIAAVLNSSTDLRRTVVLQGRAPALETCEGGDVQVRRYRPTSVVLRVNTPCRAMVVFADAWFPGWKGYLDGRPVPIYNAYNIVRAVVVDAGEHEVVMLYSPASVFTGVALAILGVVLCIGLRFRRERGSGAA
jgi:hypothetical protein